MPIYEYVCGSCGKKTEVLARITDAPLKICPHCGGKLKRAISAPAIQFKGSGWYVTDYARARQEEKASAGESAEKGEKGEAGEKAAEKGADKADKADKAADRAAHESAEKKREAASKKGSKKE
jgi:putative FmdB family regulatory protein